MTASTGTTAIPPNTLPTGRLLKATARFLRNRRQLEVLESLSDHLLANIGLTVFDVERAKRDNSL